VKNQIKIALIASFFVLISGRITPANEVVDNLKEIPDSTLTPTAYPASESVLTPTSPDQKISPKISPKLRRKQCLNENPKMSMGELKACAVGKSK
jgi:hypothetical protein